MSDEGPSSVCVEPTIIKDVEEEGEQYRFCLQNRITDKYANLGSLADLYAMMRSERTQEICDKLVLLEKEYPDKGADYEREKGNLKRLLHVALFSVQDLKGDGTRKNENAVMSGNAIIDVDDEENPRALYESFADKLAENKVWLVHKSVSNHGLRIVFELEEGEMIAQGQARVAKALGIKQYDHLGDAVRGSFVPPYNYVYYINESGLRFKSQEEADFWANQDMKSNNRKSSPPRKQRVVWLKRKGRKRIIRGSIAELSLKI